MKNTLKAHKKIKKTKKQNDNQKQQNTKTMLKSR